MGVLVINDLRDGMVLAQDIKNRHGNMLLIEGRTLTKKDIFILKTWGITEADVEGIDRDKVQEKEMEPLPSSVTESIEKELRELFPEFKNNPVMEEMYRIVKRLKLKKALTRTKEDETAQY